MTGGLEVTDLKNIISADLACILQQDFGAQFKAILKILPWRSRNQ